MLNLDWKNIRYSLVTCALVHSISSLTVNRSLFKGLNSKNIERILYPLQRYPIYYFIFMQNFNFFQNSRLISSRNNEKYYRVFIIVYIIIYKGFYKMDRWWEYHCIVSKIYFVSKSFSTASVLCLFFRLY